VTDEQHNVEGEAWQEIPFSSRMAGFRGAEQVLRDSGGKGDRLLACWNHSEFSGWAIYKLRSDGKTGSKTWKYVNTIGDANEPAAAIIG
jgi:hypothetical protein